MVDPVKIGERLTALRGDRSREAIAEALDVSASAIQMYENGKRIPRDEVKVRIAEYFEASVESIFFADEYTKRVQNKDEPDQQTG